MIDTPRSTSSTSPTAGLATTTPRPDAAGELKASIIEGAHDLTDQAKTVAGDAATQVRKAAESQISSGKDRAAEGLGSVASALRQTGNQLRSQNNAITNYVVQAAEHVETASSYLQEHSLKDTLGDLERFARREPALFLGGAFVAGLLGGRFLKSSRPRPESMSQAGAVPTGSSRNGQVGERQPGRNMSGGRSQETGAETGAKRSDKAKDNRSQNSRDGSASGANGGGDGNSPKVPGVM